jgi:hypothetical protein
MPTEEQESVVEEVGPVKLRRSGKTPEVVHLFSIEDDDGKLRKYYAKKQVGFNVTLRATRIFAERGEEAAQAYALLAVLGEEAVKALEGFDELDAKDMASIMDYAQRVVLGPGKRHHEPENDNSDGET